MTAMMAVLLTYIPHKGPAIGGREGACHGIVQQVALTGTGGEVLCDTVVTQIREMIKEN